MLCEEYMENLGMKLLLADRQDITGRDFFYLAFSMNLHDVAQSRFKREAYRGPLTMPGQFVVVLDYTLFDIRTSMSFLFFMSVFFCLIDSFQR